MAHRGSGVRDPQLLLTLFSFAALFGLTAADNLQGGKRTAWKRCRFFPDPGMQVQKKKKKKKKEAAIAHGIHGPSRSNHLSGGSLPTPQLRRCRQFCQRSATSDIGKGASMTTAPELLRRKDGLQAVRTIPRRLRLQLKRQRHCNACQQDAGNDTSGNFAEEGDLVKDNDFGRKRRCGRGRQRSRVGQR
jgi:hypothetical protein